jgi:hypothetical protein
VHQHAELALEIADKNPPNRSACVGFSLIGIIDMPQQSRKPRAPVPKIPKLPGLDPEREKSMLDDFAYNLLLGWTKAVVETNRRYQLADSNRMGLMMRRGSTAERIKMTIEDVLALTAVERDEEHKAHYERHFFLIAAWQMFRYRDWIIQRGLVPEAVFAEIDTYRQIVNRLRDMHEHADEYYKTEGQGGRKPHEWWHIEDGGIADASSTVDGKFGNLLNPVDFAAAAERLLPTLVDLDPSFRGPRAQQALLRRIEEGRRSA